MRKFSKLLMIILFTCTLAFMSACGKEKHHHVSYEWVYDQLPTCTESGVRSHICITCGEKYGTETCPATGHYLSNDGKCTGYLCSLESFSVLEDEGLLSASAYKSKVYIKFTPSENVRIKISTSNITVLSSRDDTGSNKPIGSIAVYLHSDLINSVSDDLNFISYQTYMMSFSGNGYSWNYESEDFFEAGVTYHLVLSMNKVLENNSVPLLIYFLTEPYSEQE